MRGTHKKKNHTKHDYTQKNKNCIYIFLLNSATTLGRVFDVSPVQNIILRDSQRFPNGKMYILRDYCTYIYYNMRYDISQCRLQCINMRTMQQEDHDVIRTTLLLI